MASGYQNILDFQYVGSIADSFNRGFKAGVKDVAGYLQTFRMTGWLQSAAQKLVCVEAVVRGAS
jgi:hypothetical protein